MALYLVIFA